MQWKGDTTAGVLVAGCLRVVRPTAYEQQPQCAVNRRVNKGPRGAVYDGTGRDKMLN